MVRRLVALFALSLLIALAGCGDDSGSDDDAGSAGSATTSTQADDSPSTSKSGSESGSEPSAGEGCRDVEYPPTRPDGGEKRPDSELDPSDTHDVKIQTNCGDFTIRLDPEQSPKATASFASLARNGFYDQTTFHRIVPSFVIQGGDPTGTGGGSPGYKTVDKPPADAKYTPGVVAMAKTGVEGPGTAGSQFFVVVGRDTGLTPDYAIIGSIVEGMETVDRISRQGDRDSGSAGTPLIPVVLEKASVES